MECVLLWLDELDDLICTVAVTWRSACRLGLTAGFPAALTLMTIYGTELHTRWVIGLSIIAAGSVLAWLSAVLPLVARPLRGLPSPA